ncbi:hypothetical protein NITLEN_10870 [Nitrospira lenta]|uniref:Uncharacterized protein n=1 Tax=Nitrospira lenta TaxID=1436998 RepID=A0A330L2B5_9BACT|nr:hypothetical protein NITLEN_10870 [Nitrospira lenta]
MVLTQLGRRWIALRMLKERVTETLPERES